MSSTSFKLTDKKRTLRIYNYTSTAWHRDSLCLTDEIQLPTQLKTEVFKKIQNKN